MEAIGAALALALFGAGAYFTVRLAPCFAAHPRRLWRAVRGTGKGELRSLAVALAGTLGVGNITGVAAALVLGGAGAVFWMWAAALFAMALKYAEVVLALRTRRAGADGAWHGGAFYYIRTAFGGRVGRAAGGLFAALCIGGALSLGGVIQTNAAAEAMVSAFRVPPYMTGAVLALLSLAVLLRGAARVERVLARLVPLVCVLFSVAALAVLVLRRAALPAALAAIFRGAFHAESAAGGAFGFLASRALRYGVARGLVSNEAGCGTAPIAHAAAPAREPAAQGCLGIVEVFVDTILLCTLTALVILVSGVPLAGGGTALALAAFSAVLGRAAAPWLAVSVLLFAFATVLCWARYGAESLRYFTGKKKAAAALFAAVAGCAFAGAAAAPAALWAATDLILALMAFLNLAALLKLRRTVLEETRRYFVGPEGER